MIELFSLIFLILPFLLAILLPLAGFTWIVVGARKTLVWVALYLACLFYFPNVSWGLLEKSVDSNFYNRGTGLLFFSAINIFLFGLTVQALAARIWKVATPARHNLKTPALLFSLIFAGNVLIGGSLDQVRWSDIIGYSGLLNVANFMLAFYVFMSAIRSPSDLDKLINILLFCAVTRGVWGLTRFLTMGGDPANFYSNFQKIDVTLTFFDINDSLIATFALFVVAWRIVRDPDITRNWRLIYYGVATLELFIVIFSYRRTAWGGLIAAALLFAFCQTKFIRNSLLFGYAAIGIPGLMYKLMQRSGFGLQNGSLIERLMPDVTLGGAVSFTTGRFSELYAAFLSLKDSPLIGLGAWGEFSGFRFSELAWHNGNFKWMHSGAMHLALKSGMLGLVISFVVFINMIRFVHQHKNEMPQAQLGIMMAGLAGVLFMLPNWLVGTPVIEYRTMQLMAFNFALPYMAYAVLRRKAG